MQEPVTKPSYSPTLIVEPGWHAENRNFLTDWFAEHSSLLLRVALYGFLAGYVVFAGVIYQALWLVCFALPALVFLDWARVLDRLLRDSYIISSCGFLTWMTFRSRFIGWEGNYAEVSDAGTGLLGTLLLVLFLLVVWLRASEHDHFKGAGWLFSIAAAFVALYSMYQYYVLDEHWGERLQNMVVYSGLHPVCTGVGFGFAVVWVACLWSSSQGRWTRIVCALLSFVLLMACFLTASRGALLAIVCAYIVLSLKAGWKRAAGPWILLAVTAIVYWSLTPLLQNMWEQKMHAQGGPLTPVEIPAEVAEPFTDLIQRGDAGRLQIYQAGIRSLESQADYLIGIGQWGRDSQWRELLPWMADENLRHLHSAFLSTFVHGGLIGLLLLLMVVATGVKRAWHLAKHGNYLWMVLGVFGCSALIWDGQSLSSVASLPLFETLVFWLPMTAAAATCFHQRQACI